MGFFLLLICKRPAPFSQYWQISLPFWQFSSNLLMVFFCQTWVLCFYGVKDDETSGHLSPAKPRPSEGLWAWLGHHWSLLCDRGSLEEAPEVTQQTLLSQWGSGKEGWRPGAISPVSVEVLLAEVTWTRRDSGERAQPWDKTESNKRVGGLSGASPATLRCTIHIILFSFLLSFLSFLIIKHWLLFGRWT